MIKAKRTKIAMWFFICAAAPGIMGINLDSTMMFVKTPALPLNGS